MRPKMTNVRSLIDVATYGQARRFTLGNRYALAREVRLEGQGQAFLADDTDAARQVLAVVARVDWVDDSSRRERFEHQARKLQSLEQANLSALLDFGFEDDLAYVICERSDGERLADRLSRKRSMTPHEAIPIMSQLLKVLEHVHARELVARSLSPANLFLSTDGVHANVLRVFGVGLAELLVNDPSAEEAALLCNPAFAAPEQLAGHAATPASDVYAAARLMETMLLGPDDDTVLPASQRGGRSRIDSSSRIAGSLREFLNTCLRLDPETRPASGAEMVEFLIDSVPTMSMLRLQRVTGSLPEAGQSTSRAKVVPSTPPPEQRDATTKEPEEPVDVTTDPAPVQSRSKPWFLLAGAATLIAGLAAWSTLRSGSPPGESSSTPSAPSQAPSVEAAAIASPPKRTEDEPRPVATKANAKATPAALSQVRIESEPVGEIRIDGERRGATPFAGELPPGEHDVEIIGDDGVSWSQTIDVRPGHNETWSLHRAAPEVPEEPTGRKRRTRSARKTRAAADPPSTPTPAPVAPQPSAPAKKADPFLPPSKKQTTTQDADLLPAAEAKQ